MEAVTQTEEEQVNIIEPLFILEIVMVFFMYRSIAFWIKFICKVQATLV
jgi:hypothetical protein